MKKVLKIIIFTLLVFVFAYLAYLFLTHPSNNREWTLDQSVLPYAKINDGLVTIHNIRNFTYQTTSDYTPAYYDKTFDLNKIKSVDFILEPFSDFAGAAHTFLSFGFDNNEYVSVSIEIRKEQGESFSPLKGMFNQYEIMYVIADEQDAVKLRSNFRKDKVYIYPVKTTQAKMQELFLSMITEANQLKDKPLFYNTLTNTCTTGIMKHVNKITPKRIPFSYKILFPGYSDELAFELGLVDTDLSLEEARQKFLINDRAEKYANDPNFSTLIRQTEIQ